MDKKSDTPMLAAPATGGSALPLGDGPRTLRPRVKPATGPRATPEPVEEEWDGPLEEAIFRPVLDDNGNVDVQILPPTLYDLTHPKEEDTVSQSNRHARTLGPIDDILRRKVEKTTPGAGVFIELLVKWPDPKMPDSSPDTFVAIGLKRPPEEIEGSFDVAEEGVVPRLIFEVVSATYKSTRDKDYAFNLKHYAKAGVQELVLVEPVTKGSPEIKNLEAYRLDPQGTYQKIPPDGKGRTLLETVGFYIYVEGAAIVIEDAKTGERFLNSWEEENARKAEAAGRREAEDAREAEAAARREAEAEVARLREEIERLRGGS